MRYLLVLMASAVLFLLLTAGSCEKKQKPAECPPDVICTMIFASVSTKIMDSQGAPVKLDEVHTLRKSNNEVLKYDHNAAEGFYVIVDDSYQKDLANQTDTFQLTGKRNGETVVQESFVVSADCCHVKKVSGKSEIRIP